ncbi:MAG: hypothetical protein QW589_00555 [Candidatus Bathyarchaeia archaeon]
MVKTILDSFCVKSGILCPKCEEKVKKGLVTELDLKTINVLYELEKEYTGLQDVFFHKAIDEDNMLVIMVEKQDINRFLSYGGKLLRKLSEKMDKKRIKILSYKSTTREFLEELFSPFSILTINTIWLPDGSTETRVILHGKKPKRMPISLESIKKIAKKIRGLTLRIDFEKS